MTVGDLRLTGFTWRPLGRRDPVVADLDLRVERGERVLLVGPSGSGKSTILLGLAGALGTTLSGDLDGTIEVEGRIGLLTQNPDDSIVAERMGRDVAFGPENVGLPRDEIWRRVDESLAAVGLAQGRDHLSAALSGGERQRLALAGVLALRPDALLLDEPTAMLDDATAASVRSAIDAVVGDRTLLVVEHRIGPWLDLVDRVVVLDRGVVVQDTDVATFRAAVPPAGVWAPGMKVPEPLAVPSALVEPVVEAPVVEAADVDVELVLRTLRGAQRTRALRGFTARFAPGRLTALTGPSGAGKSTALAAIGGLVKPAAGVLTPDLARRRSRDLAAEVGWVPQNPEHGFLTSMVADEVARTARVLDRVVDVEGILDVFGLDRYAPSNPHRLSGGEQRRLALAAALAHRPGLLLLDEPTVGQDPTTWAAVAGWTRAAAAVGATVVASTHDADLPRDVELGLVGGVLA